MRKLETVQKEEKLNDAHSIGEIGPGGAYHHYMVVKHGETPVAAKQCGTVLADITYQKGPRRESSSISGILDGDLLEIVRDRLKSFQAGEFANEYNAEALEHVEAALEALNRRVEDRIKRNVLGTNNK